MTRTTLLALADTYAKIAAHLDGVLSKRPCMDYPATVAAHTTAKQFESACRAIAWSMTDD